MAISDVSIRNPVFAWMLMLALMVFGAIGFSRMGVSQMPDADFPVLTVQVTLEGAAPEVIETTVIDPLEDALMTVEGLEGINSSSRSGSGSITLEFALEKNIDVALQEVQTKIAQAQRRLPEDVEPPVITKSNPEDQPIMWLALTYDKDDRPFLNQYARDFVQDRFTTVPGVGEVFLGGYTAPALRVWVKPEALRRYNVAVSDIIDAIQSEHSELPGGSIEEGRKLFNVRTIGEAKTVEEFREIPINKRAGQQISDPANTIRIKDVAHIEEGLDEVRRIARFNGETALGMGVRKQRGANAVAVAKAVKQRMAEIQKDLPAGMKMNVNFDSTRFIENSVHELNSHLVLAVILTSLVCWLFLGSWSATLNVLLSIPTSIMGAFIGLYFFGFTLNTFTLLGLTLAIGIVVDDAIMVLENIFRYREMGKSRVQAAILGSREIAFAAMAATVAVVAIFLPVAFMKGVIGKYFLQFGVTISLAVLLSLLESLTITPMRAASFVNTAERTSKLGKAFDAFFEKFEAFYRHSLEKGLGKPKTVVVGSVIFMILSFFLVRFIPKEFVPAQDQSLFMIRAQTPVGSSLAYTDEQSKKAEEWILKQPEVKQVFANVGGFGGGETNTVMMFVTLHPKNQRDVTQGEIMERARKELSKIPDFKPRIQDLSMRGFSASGRGYPIEFTLQGGDWDKLHKASEQIMSEMEKSGMMTDVDTNYLLGMPEVQIKPARIQAAMHGVSVQTIGSTINSLIGGVRVGQYQKEGQRNDIRLQLVKQKDTVEEMKNLLIGNARGNLIPLSRVVNQKTEPALQQITRVDRQRSISVYANLKPGSSQQQAMEFVEKKARQTLPEGYRFSAEGSAQTFKDSFTSLIFALILGILVAYMVLAAQFNSFLDPVTILMALPFSISGVFFALLVTFQSLNIYSMIGILLLMGIVKKNSIMLVEFTNHIREKDSNIKAKKALLEACPIRLRPILMTSIATMAAAVPSAMAMGDGAETVRPMAITIIGGVFVSTILTLYVIPAVYLMFDRFRKVDESRERIKQAYSQLGEPT